VIHRNEASEHSVALENTLIARATFVTTAITDDTITGNLTLHGVSQSITCPAHWKIEPGKLEVDAKMTIRQSSFAMQSARTTNDEVPVEILIEADRAGYVPR
jgi:polyisoprenoid-binding protein YceI